MVTAIAAHPDTAEVWRWLAEIPDPEVPVVSIVDLGIVRGVEWNADDECVISVTPTYSGCPATEVIAADIKNQLTTRGIKHVKLQIQLSPPWTTDWLSEKAKQNLREYGIAPPQANSAALVTIALAEPAISCPRCNSTRTTRLSQFGSTPCKALFRCEDCLEPFDYFKCH